MWRARRVARETSEGPRRSRSRRGREGASRTLDPFLPGKGLRITRQPKESLAPPRLFLRNFHGDLSSCSVEGVEFPPQTHWAKAQSGGRGRPWEGLGKSSAGGSFSGGFLPGSDHCLLWPLSQVRGRRAPPRGSGPPYSGKIVLLPSVSQHLLRSVD